MEFEKQLETAYLDAVRFSRGLAGSGADGDDLLQDALIRAMRGYTGLRNRSRFRYWLLRIISNTHRSRIRRERLRRWVTLDLTETIPARPGLSFEDKDAVRRALKDVPLAQREALVLFEVVGMSIREIAETQKVKESAVKSRLARGRNKLRDRYNRLTGEEGNHAYRIAEAD